ASAARRVIEGEVPRVKSEARKAVERLAVHEVAEYGPSARREVNTNLMTPSGHETAPQPRHGRPVKRAGSEPLEDGHARRSVARDTPPAALRRVGGERQSDAAGLLGGAADDREIDLLACR